MLIGACNPMLRPIHVFRYSLHPAHGGARRGRDGDDDYFYDKVELLQQEVAPAMSNRSAATPVEEATSGVPSAASLPSPASARTTVSHDAACAFGLE